MIRPRVIKNKKLNVKIRKFYFEEPYIEKVFAFREQLKEEKYLQHTLEYSDLLRVLNGYSDRCYIACIDNENYSYDVIGMYIYSLDYQRFCADLHYLAVLKKYRRRGVATLLLKSLDDVVSTFDLCFIRVCVDYRNKPALKCFEKNGYEFEYRTGNMTYLLKSLADFY